MKIRTFVTNTAEELDKQVNDFEDKYIVKAGQSHVLDMNGSLKFMMVSFYTGEKE